MTTLVPYALLMLPLAFAAAGMPDDRQFARVTPNVLVADMARSIAFYRDVLGFALDMKVPDEAPYIFVSMKRGDVEVFLNDATSAVRDFPLLAGRPLGGTNTMYVKLNGGIDAYFEQVKDRATIVLPLTRQPYGMIEFALTDPDGYVVFFAQEGGR
jgi:uncharacterized glyoxalase superfamily protein PhnB